MKNIRPFNNTPTIVHISQPVLITNTAFFFGFNPGKLGKTPTVRVNVRLISNAGSKNEIRIATYDSIYEISGEGLVLEDHIHACCEQAVYAMKIFLQYNEIGRTIPQAIFRCPGKEAFGDDLIVLAKSLNSLEGKRGFPMG